MGRLVSNDGPIYTQLYSFLAHLHTAVFILGPIQLLHSCSWWGCPQFNNPISQIQNKSDLKNLFMERERESKPQLQNGSLYSGKCPLSHLRDNPETIAFDLIATILLPIYA